MYQIVEITVVDGVVLTSTERNAEYFLTKSLWPTIERFRRQMHFTGGVVPGPYAWTLTNKGVTWPDAEFVTIDYLPDEFKRICEIEIKSGHNHLIDGQRRAYLREPLAPMESK